MKLHALLITLVFTHLCMAMDQPAEDIKEPSLDAILDDCSQASLYFFHEPRLTLSRKAFRKIQKDSKNAQIFNKLSKLKKRKNHNKNKAQPHQPLSLIKKPQINAGPIPFKHITILKQKFGSTTANELIPTLVAICGHLCHHPRCNDDNKEYGPYWNDQCHVLFIKLESHITATYNPCNNMLTTGYCNLSMMMNAPKELLPEKVLCDQSCKNRLTLLDSSCNGYYHSH